MPSLLRMSIGYFSSYYYGTVGIRQVWHCNAPVVAKGAVAPLRGGGGTELGFLDREIWLAESSSL